MPTAYFVQHRGDVQRIVLAGDKLITGAGETAVVQQFDNPRAAKEHLEMVLSRRRREGYRVEMREISAADLGAGTVPEGPDPLADCVAFEPDHRRMTVTFRGHEVPPGRCVEVVMRAAELAPGSMQVLCDLASPGQTFAAALLRLPLPSLTALAFDTHFQTVTRQAKNSPGDVADLLAALPQLENLFVTGDVTLRPTRHDNLDELYLLGDPLRGATLTALAACKFPRLGVLALRLAADAACRDELLAAEALQRLDAPQLRYVEVAGVHDLTAFLAALAVRPVPPSWEALRLTGTVRDEDAFLSLLASHANRFESLAEFGLPLADGLSREGAVHARRILDAIDDSGELPDRLAPDVYDRW